MVRSIITLNDLTADSVIDSARVGEALKKLNVAEAKSAAIDLAACLYSKEVAASQTESPYDKAVKAIKAAEKAEDVATALLTGDNVILTEVVGFESEDASVSDSTTTSTPNEGEEAETSGANYKYN